MRLHIKLLFSNAREGVTLVRDCIVACSFGRTRMKLLGGLECPANFIVLKLGILYEVRVQKDGEEHHHGHWRLLKL